MSKFKEKIEAIFKSKEVRNKILFSLMIMVFFRALSAVPVVGITGESIRSLFEGTEIGDMLSTVSGGILESASIVAIGLTPYINASIIFQLLGTVIPKLDEMQKEGQEGRRKIQMYTRILAVPLAILQSFVIYATLRGFGLVDKLDVLHLITMCATLTAGSIITMWFGELVSEDGVGGGSSYLIMLGILSGVPGTFRSLFQTMDPFQKWLYAVIMLVMVIAVVIITEAERRVTIQYSRRQRTGGALESYIPIKPTQSGVMPVIFASAFISFPQLIGKLLISRDISDTVTRVSQKVLDILANDYVSNSIQFVLIIMFSFFYLSVVFKTDELAENLQKQGAFIQGIRPGENTSSYLRKISLRLTAVGALFLAILAILPNILQQVGLISGAVISGTGLLIVVGVVLDIKREVESMITVRSYDKYL